MIFNFFLGNHRALGLRGLPDLLQPIFHGLVEAGHHVMGYGLGLRPAPAVNVLVEFFPDDNFADELIKMKRQVGDGMCFGVLCTEDIEDRLVMEQPEFPRRRANLERILAAADFVWTLLPIVPAYEALAGRGKVALLRYGFSERYLSPRLISDPALRDVDSIMYGNLTPYRQGVTDALKQRSVGCFFSDRQAFPSFVTADLIRRSKVVLDVRRGPEVRFPSPTRIIRGLHHGAVVVSEDLGPSPIADLYAYTVTGRYEELADRCADIVRGGNAVELGMAALQKFRTATSMRDNIAAALRLPALAGRAV